MCDTSIQLVSHLDNQMVIQSVHWSICCFPLLISDVCIKYVMQCCVCFVVKCLFVWQKPGWTAGALLSVMFVSSVWHNVVYCLWQKPGWTLWSVMFVSNVWHNVVYCLWQKPGWTLWSVMFVSSVWHNVVYCLWQKPGWTLWSVMFVSNVWHNLVYCLWQKPGWTLWSVMFVSNVWHNVVYCLWQKPGWTLWSVMFVSSVWHNVVCCLWQKPGWTLWSVMFVSSVWHNVVCCLWQKPGWTLWSVMFVSNVWHNVMCCLCGRNLAGQQEHCGQWCLYPVCDTMLCAVCVAETWLDSRSTVIPTPTAGVWWDMPSCVPFWPICAHSCHKLALNSQVTYISSLHTFSHIWLYCLCTKTQASRGSHPLHRPPTFLTVVYIYVDGQDRNLQRENNVLWFSDYEAVLFSLKFDSCTL